VEELRHDREVRLQRRLGLGRCGLTLARRRTPQDHIFWYFSICFLLSEDFNWTLVHS
jgi:hypothetical protein